MTGREDRSRGDGEEIWRWNEATGHEERGAGSLVPPFQATLLHTNEQSKRARKKRVGQGEARSDHHAHVTVTQQLTVINTARRQPPWVMPISSPHYQHNAMHIPANATTIANSYHIC
jgi:hypothetical protein